MLELLTTSAMTVGSTLLLAYWFRYSCLLILNAQTARDYAAEVATENQLGFREVQLRLPVCAAADLCRLQQTVERDYAVVQALLYRIRQHESKLEIGMLKLHYRLLSVWCSVSRSLSANAARQALSEMCLVVGHLANGVGEAAAA
jgi:hypothetical protein